MPGRLQLRSAVECSEVRDTSSLMIDPSLRARVQAALVMSGETDWEQPASEWQSTHHAVFSRDGELQPTQRVAISLPTPGGSPVLILDSIISIQAGARISASDLVNELSSLIALQSVLLALRLFGEETARRQARSMGYMLRPTAR